MPIPKRIYQTWKTKNLPWGIKDVIKNMMELNGRTTLKYLKHGRLV